jgi:NAD(P)-dependent dehydrogenase (short-subunit alcohol dehydrogenase family)
VALMLAEAGAAVVVNGVTQERVEEVVATIRGQGGEAVGVVETVATPEGAQRIVATAIDRFRRIDILVNSAGLKREATILAMSLDDWHQLIDVQLNGVFYCSQAAARAMVAQGDGGRIISMAGGSTAHGLPLNSNHAASKGGVLAATLSWAAELEPYGITVNAVRAAISTLCNEKIRGEFRAQFAATGKPVPATNRELGFYTPEEAAPLVIWLASAAAGGVTGRFLALDGPRLGVWQGARPVSFEFHFPRWTLAELTAVVPSVLPPRESATNLLYASPPPPPPV